MAAKAHADYAGWLVNHGQPVVRRAFEPPRRALVTAETYSGAIATLELDVLFSATGLVCVRQDLPGREPWLAWIPAECARPISASAAR